MDFCDPCQRAHTSAAFKVPTHLVHPVDGAAMLFNVFSEAICPDCGAMWRRERNVAVLISPERKGPKRVERRAA